MKEQAKLDAKERAKAAAERIKAQIEAKRAIQQVEVPPIRSVQHIKHFSTSSG